MKLIKLLQEQRLPETDRKQLMRDFIKFCIRELGLKKPIKCKIILTNNKDKTSTYAHYQPGKEIIVYMGDRSLGDGMRSLCHELQHHKQFQEGRLTQDSGKTGSDIENESNSTSGIIMRKFGKLYPQIYE